MMWAGDMAFYYAPIDRAVFESQRVEIMTAMPAWRLIVGGALAPAAWGFFVLGFWALAGHLNINARLRRVVLISLSAGMAFAVLYHSAFTLYGFPDLGVSPVILSAWLKGLLAGFILVSLPGWAVLIWAISSARSAFSRWAVLALPVVLFSAQPLAWALPVPFGMLIGGGFTNLCFLPLFLWSAYLCAHREHSRSKSRA